MRGLCRRAVSVCPSVRPSCCLSRSCIVSKRVIESSIFRVMLDNFRCTDRRHDCCILYPVHIQDDPAISEHTFLVMIQKLSWRLCLPTNAIRGLNATNGYRLIIEDTVEPSCRSEKISLKTYALININKSGRTQAMTVICSGSARRK